MKSLLGLSMLSGSVSGDDLFFEDKPASQEDAHTISFQEVPVIEFIRFVSRISHVNFIFNDKELEFNISLSSGKPVSSSQVLQSSCADFKSSWIYSLERRGVSCDP